MKRIVILERINEPSDFSFRYLFWADVPSARQSYYANSSFVSAYKDIDATTLTNLKNGSLVEKTDTANYVAGTSFATIGADLISRFTKYQALITSVNPWLKFGTSYDDSTSTWTQIGVN